MKILVFGASKGIGHQLLTLALNEGHEVTALLRYPDKFKITDPHLHVIKGDILDRSSISDAVSGQDAICVCIGIPPAFKLVEVFSKGINNVIASIKKDSEQKLIVITGIGAGESSGHGGFLFDRIFKPLLLKEIYKDKDREEVLIRESDTEWMIVRPGFLTNGPRTGKYRVIEDLKGITAKKISRLDVADFMLKELKMPRHFKKTLLVTY